MMKCRGYQLSCWIVFLSTIAAVPSQDNELNTPKDSCLINEERQSLICDSSVLSTDSPALYVPEETLCRHMVKDTCFVCQKGVLSQTKCPKGQRLRRQRRGFRFSIRDIIRKLLAKLIVCKVPSAPDNGQVKCPGVTFYKKQCVFSCDDGYKLVGSRTATCTKSRVFTPSPKCQKIQCDSVKLPSNANGVHCSNGFKHRSVCSVSCRQGYVAAAGSRSFCGDDGKWNQNAWKCQDTVKPVFSNCPTKKINTIDRRFRWSVTATDNTGKVTVKQIQGNPPGSLLEYGAHLIKYQASDETGNMAFCSFVVELKRTGCPRPSSNDTDIKFMCNGITADSYCQLSCKSGSMVKGSKYIKCEQDKSQNNTSAWQPVEGVEAYCQRRTCPALNTPKNGALVCDKQRGGTICQIQCNEDYDVAYSEQRHHTFVCGSNSDAWSPSNTAPDCLELAFPDEYYLPTDFFYYMGDCSDEVEMRKIKQQFIDNLNSIGISPCMTDVCSVDDVELSCGEEEESEFEEFRRRRRSTKKVLRVRLTFRLKNSNRTLSPRAAAALLKSLADKSKIVMSTNTAMRRMLYKTLPKPTLPSRIFIPQSKILMKSSHSSSFGGTKANVQANIERRVVLPSKVKSKSVLGKMSMHCPQGSVQRSEVCVPCSAGTYASKDRCLPCGVNTYQDRPGSSLCLNCPLHHITFSTGAANKTACKELCKKDSFSLTGVQPCFPCPDGKYQMQYGGKTCTVCPDSNPARRTIPKCSKRTSPANGTMASKFKISNFLLTCDSEVCLSF